MGILWHRNFVGLGPKTFSVAAIVRPVLLYPHSSLKHPDHAEPLDEQVRERCARSTSGSGRFDLKPAPNSLFEVEMAVLESPFVSQSITLFC